ncbi:hypothetical protein HAX54_036412, partial [Datura stramonium]|nr:hypothetical protein [Datura stramonium]
FAKTLMEHRSKLQLASGYRLESHYIGGSRIGIGDSQPCRWCNSYLPRLLLYISEPAAVRGYHGRLTGAPSV